MAYDVHRFGGMQTIAGRDGITMQVTGNELAIIRDGQARKEVWANAADLAARIAALSTPVVLTSEDNQIAYWRN